MFKWVHISDIHFNEQSGANAVNIKNQLLTTLGKINDVDALFITGDFRFAPKSCDIDKTVAYINRLASALKIKTEMVFCVPGNHDLTRSKLRDHLIDAIVGIKEDTGDYDPSKGTFDKEELELLKNGFDFFSSIETELYGKKIMSDNSRVHVVKELPACNLLLLNTAITAGKSDDRASLLLGSSYLLSALNQLDKNKPTIMIGHHGHSYFLRAENKMVQTHLEHYGIKLYICGHEHDLWHESAWCGVQQFTAGCIWDSESDTVSKAGFFVGELDDNSKVSISAFEWRVDLQEWYQYPKILPSFYLLDTEAEEHRNNGTALESTETVTSIIEEKYLKILAKYNSIPQKVLNFELNGHTLLGGRGKEGIKYYWLKDSDRVESIAFNTRLYFPNPDPKKKAEDDEISAYTTSVSFGCILASSGHQCRFCETGSREFKGLLSAEEIALQNIFMASYDADCPSFPEVRNHKREFAFMGQGEPGSNYNAVRRAILLTDRALKAINQEVHRYIISTCGMHDFMYSLISDVKAGIFSNRVTLHFSLHKTGLERAKLMPIEMRYNYKEFIELCKSFYNITNDFYGKEEKVGVGILMFKDFLPTRRTGEQHVAPTTLDKKSLRIILSELDPKVFRIDLCDLNKAPSVTESRGEFSNEEANELLAFVTSQGFEAKTFSSFGSDSDAGCGILKSTYVDAAKDGTKTIEQFDKAKGLLHYAINELKSEDLR